MPNSVSSCTGSESEDSLGASDDLGGDPALGVKKHRHRRTMGSEG
jgi:hypothetical protein